METLKLDYLSLVLLPKLSSCDISVSTDLISVLVVSSIYCLPSLVLLVIVNKVINPGIYQNITGCQYQYFDIELNLANLNISIAN